MTLFTYLYELFLNALKTIFTIILAIIVLIEEWLWDTLAIIGEWLDNTFNLQKIDNWLIQASPPQALIALLIPIIVITPFNILGLRLLAMGLIIQGIAIEIIVKLITTLFVARIFRLVKPALLTFFWFSKIYHFITGILKWAHDSICHTFFYQWAHCLKQYLKLKNILFF